MSSSPLHQRIMNVGVFGLFYYFLIIFLRLFIFYYFYFLNFFILLFFQFFCFLNILLIPFYFIFLPPAPFSACSVRF